MSETSATPRPYSETLLPDGYKMNDAGNLVRLSDGEEFNPMGPFTVVVNGVEQLAFGAGLKIHACNPFGTCPMPRCPDCPDMGAPE